VLGLATDMATTELKLSVKLAWWVKPYCYAMVAWYHLTGRDASSEQITAWVMRGVKIEVA